VSTGVSTSDRPNIVLINCDDLGYGDLGCYGSTRNDTPALDRLASEGLRCTDVSMASPVCSPSRGALLTGCYPPRIGFGSFEGLPVLFPGQPVGLPPSEVSLGRLLSDAGYATLMVGKWHCGDQPEFLPTNHGFDHYFGLPYSNDMGRQAGTPVDTDGHQPGYPPLPLLDDDEVLEQQPDQASLTGRYVTEVLRFMRTHRDQPFFVYLAHLYVHLPIYVPDEFARRSRNGAYGAAVASIDWATDVVLAELDRLGLAERTLVVFTSDNGALDRPDGGSNLPLRGHKGSTWEGGVRVPFLARWPGRIEPGRVCDELVSSVDLYPTFARLAGTRPPEDRTIDGVDVTGLLLDGEPSPREHLALYFMDDLCAVRDARWKLHVARDGVAVCELYDLQADPGESVDVAAQHAHQVQRLERVAEDVRERLGDARLGRTGAEVRPIGRVPQASTLTTYDPRHPYYAAEYDLPDRG
jgi:arylsulfatase A-like enzyme